MKENSPLIPQGTLPESKPRERSGIILAVFGILGFHVLLLGALLLQGCKDRPATNVADNNQNTTVTPTPPVTPPSNSLPGDLGWQNPVAPAQGSNATASLPPPIIPATSNVATLPSLPSLPPTGVAPATGTGVTEYEVQKGDSFYVIAKKFKTTSQEIAKANPNVNPQKLRPGQKIKIPEKATTVAAVAGTGTDAGTTVTAPAASATAPAPAASATAPATAAGESAVYQVKRGDTLTKIAKTHHTSVKAIMAANGLTRDNLKVGQKLKIPGKAAAPETVTPTTAGATASISG